VAVGRVDVFEEDVAEEPVVAEGPAVEESNSADAKVSSVDDEVAVANRVLVAIDGESKTKVGGVARDGELASAGARELVRTRDARVELPDGLGGAHDQAGSSVHDQTGAVEVDGAAVDVNLLAGNSPGELEVLGVVGADGNVVERASKLGVVDTTALSVSEVEHSNLPKGEDTAGCRVDVRRSAVKVDTKLLVGPPSALLDLLEPDGVVGTGGPRQAEDSRAHKFVEVPS
jgi:hypothetical protein